MSGLMDELDTLRDQLEDMRAGGKAEADGMDFLCLLVLGLLFCPALCLLLVALLFAYL